MDRPRKELQNHVFKKDNLSFLAIRQMMDNIPYSHFLVTSKLSIDRVFTCSRGAASIFPLYRYAFESNEKQEKLEKETNSRKPNFSPEFIQDLETRLTLQFIPEERGDFKETISALDVFFYMYAVFHSPTYRTRYAEFLKIDFPRLPLTDDKVLFKKLAELGEQLINVHLMDAEIENECSFPIEGNNLIEKVIYKDNKVFVNKTQYFDNVTPAIWDFYIGGYQVCQKWLKDRKGKTLSYEDCTQYLYILAAIEKTQDLMEQIDAISGFPF